MLEKTDASVVYRGGEGQSVFPIPFPFLETSHIVAAFHDAEEKETPLVPGCDYAISRLSDEHGELVLLGAPPAAGESLVVSRRVPLTQEILFHNQGPNSPRATEEALDKLTMIAQQFREDLTERPTREENALIAADAVAGVEQSCRTLQAALNNKAEKTHSHSITALEGFAEAVAGKADAAALQSGLDGVRSSLAATQAALAGKADGNDPRFARIDAHAARHAVGGPDRLLPADLGVLPAPPADGKAYLAAAGGWIEYLPPAGTGGGGNEDGEGDGEGNGGGGGGTMDHAQLLNRDAADQHPQSAIQHLPGDLLTLRNDLVEARLDLVALQLGLAAKADADALPQLASASADGLLSAADKSRLDSLDETFAAWDMRLNELEDSLEQAEAGVTGLMTRATDYESGTAVLEGRVGGLENSFAGLGGLAGVADAPSDGKQYARKNGAWSEVVAPSGGGSAGGGIVGEIRLLPFRRADLPMGWYFCNGDQYPLSSPQGTALSGLPSSMKTDWGITVTGSNISLPTLFTGSDGYFLRPVNNVARQPGSKQTDAIRNITGSLSYNPTTGSVMKNATAGDSVLTGAFAAGTFNKNNSSNSYSYGPSSGANLEFDASRSVPTASENRPLNIGMTPAIYLGA